MLKELIREPWFHSIRLSLSNVHEVCIVKNAKKHKYLPHSLTEKTDNSIMPLKLRHFNAQCLKNLRNEKRDNERISATLSHSIIQVMSSYKTPFCCPMFKKLAH